MCLFFLHETTVSSAENFSFIRKNFLFHLLELFVSLGRNFSFTSRKLLVRLGKTVVFIGRNKSFVLLNTLHCPDDSIRMSVYLVCEYPSAFSSSMILSLNSP